MIRRNKIIIITFFFGITVDWSLLLQQELSSQISVRIVRSNLCRLRYPWNSYCNIKFQIVNTLGNTLANCCCTRRICGSTHLGSCHTWWKSTYQFLRYLQFTLEVTSRALCLCWVAGFFFFWSVIKEWGKTVACLTHVLWDGNFFCCFVAVAFDSDKAWRSRHYVGSLTMVNVKAKCIDFRWIIFLGHLFWSRSIKPFPRPFFGDRNGF